jgi:hypothetical protein
MGKFPNYEEIANQIIAELERNLSFKRTRKKNISPAKPETK